MLPPTWTRAPEAARRAAARAVVVLFPLEPVTPSTGASQRSRKRAISLVTGPLGGEQFAQRRALRQQAEADDEVSGRRRVFRLVQIDFEDHDLRFGQRGVEGRGAPVHVLRQKVHGAEEIDVALWTVDLP